TIASTWIDGARAIHAENEVLRWLGAEVAGMGPNAGGAFVSGGSAGNLSALVTARHVARERLGDEEQPRWRIACSDTAHSSVSAAARVMDVGVLDVRHDERARLTGSA